MICNRVPQLAGSLVVYATLCGCETLLLAQAPSTQSDPEVKLVVMDAPSYVPIPPPPELSVSPGAVRLSWKISDAILCDVHHANVTLVAGRLTLRVISRRAPEHQDSDDCGVLAMSRDFDATITPLPSGSYEVELIREKIGTDFSRLLGTWDDVIVPPG